MTAITLPAVSVPAAAPAGRRVPDAPATAAAADGRSTGRGRHRNVSAARGIDAWALTRRITRLALGVVLGILAVGSIILAVIVGTQHVGFSPVLSPSMQPTFAPGDLVLTRPEPANQLHVGQVAVLPVPGEQGQRYVHRIISISYQHGAPVVHTKGDANSAPESFQLRITSNTVPVVIGSVPHLGRLTLLLRGGTWRIAGIAVIALLLLVGVKRALLNR